MYETTQEYLQIVNRLKSKIDSFNTNETISQNEIKLIESRTMLDTLEELLVEYKQEVVNVDALLKEVETNLQQLP